MSEAPRLRCGVRLVGSAQEWLPHVHRQRSSHSLATRAMQSKYLPATVAFCPSPCFSELESHAPRGTSSSTQTPAAVHQSTIHHPGAPLPKVEVAGVLPHYCSDVLGMGQRGHACGERKQQPDTRFIRDVSTIAVGMAQGKLCPRKPEPCCVDRMLCCVDATSSLSLGRRRKRAVLSVGLLSAFVPTAPLGGPPGKSLP